MYTKDAKQKMNDKDGCFLHLLSEKKISVPIVSYNIYFICYIVYTSGDTEAIEELLESLFLALVRLLLSFTVDLLEAPENNSSIIELLM